jgi:hypothetical protein
MKAYPGRANNPPLGARKPDVGAGWGARPSIFRLIRIAAAAAAGLSCIGIMRHAASSRRQRYLSVCLTRIPIDWIMRSGSHTATEMRSGWVLRGYRQKSRNRVGLSWV